MRYYTIQNNGIIIAENEKNLTRFYDNVLPLPDDYIEGKYTAKDGKLEQNPDWEEEQTQKRKDAFLHDFFKVEGFGYYRKEPKGYQSAVESMNVLYNVANITNGLQAGLIIFYQEPDFAKEKECTEQWLVEHQIVQPAMTLEQFMDLYVAFMTAWNNENHNMNNQ